MARLLSQSFFFFFLLFNCFVKVFGRHIISRRHWKKKQWKHSTSHNILQCYAAAVGGVPYFSHFAEWHLWKMALNGSTWCNQFARKSSSWQIDFNSSKPLDQDPMTLFLSFLRMCICHATMTRLEPLGFCSTRRKQILIDI